MPGDSGAERLSLAQARRIALAAQGFADPRPGPGAATIAAPAAGRRPGRHRPDRQRQRPDPQPVPAVLLPARPLRHRPARPRPRPVAAAPGRVLGARGQPHPADARGRCSSFRMQRALSDSWGGMQRVARDHPELVAGGAGRGAARGPITSREVERALEHDLPRRHDEWGWNWSLVKAALEHLFWAGQISSAGRTASSSAATPRSSGCCRVRWRRRRSSTRRRVRATRTRSAS